MKDTRLHADDAINHKGNQAIHFLVDMMENQAQDDPNYTEGDGIELMVYFKHGEDVWTIELKKPEAEK